MSKGRKLTKALRGDLAEVVVGLRLRKKPIRFELQDGVDLQPVLKRARVQAGLRRKDAGGQGPLIEVGMVPDVRCRMARVGLTRMEEWTEKSALDSTRLRSDQKTD